MQIYVPFFACNLRKLEMQINLILLRQQGLLACEEIKSLSVKQLFDARQMNDSSEIYKLPVLENDD